MGSLEEVPQAKLWRALAAQLKRLDFNFFFFLILLCCLVAVCRSSFHHVGSFFVACGLSSCGTQVLEHVSFRSCVTEA